jgi:hypothetical protein
MKKTLLGCIIALQLSGCDVYTAFTTAGFDNQEYALTNKVRTIAQAGSCTQPAVDNLWITSLELKNYTQYIPHNDKSIELTGNLYKMVDELHNRESISPAYCKAKLNIVEKSAEEIQRVEGMKTR